MGGLVPGVLVIHRVADSLVRHHVRHVQQIHPASADPAAHSLIYKDALVAVPSDSVRRHDSTADKRNGASLEACCDDVTQRARLWLAEPLLPPPGHIELFTSLRAATLTPRSSHTHASVIYIYIQTIT